MKSNYKTFAIIILIALNLIFSKNLKSNKVNRTTEYSKNTTPEIIKDIFHVAKRINPNESKMYNECMNAIAVSRNEREMKTFWKEVQNVSCNKLILKKEHFINLLNSTTESIKVDGYEQECKGIVEKDLSDQLDLESEIAQKKLREVIGLYFICPDTTIMKNKGLKSLITAFTSVHRGSAQTNVFAALNHRK